jgi:WD40 repeat protein
VAFSPDGSSVASAGDHRDATVRLWELQTRRYLRSFARHDHGVYHLAFSPDGKRLATAGADNAVLVWGLED